MAANTSYVRPHTEVYQFLDRTLPATGQHISACVVGAQYDLYRYGKEVLEGTKVPDTVSTSIPVSFTYDKDDANSYKLDTKSMQVYGENLHLELATPEFTSGVASGTDYTSVRWSGKVIAGTGLTEDMGDYAIQEGDIVLLSSGSKKTYAKVVELLLADGSLDSYDGIRVDVTPVDLSTSSITLNDIKLEKVIKPYSGLVSIATDGIHEATKTVDVVPTVTLSKVLETGEDKTAAIEGGFGTLYPEFRMMVIHPEDDEVLELRNLTELQEQLGTVDPANEISYAAYCALEGAAGRSVYAVRVQGNTKEDYLAAMGKTDSNVYTYCFVPVVDGSGAEDIAIIQAVVDFNHAKSQPEVQMWRQTYCGIDSVGERSDDVKFVGQSSAAVTAYINKDEDGRYTLVQLGTAGLSFRSLVIDGTEGSLHAGDFIVNNGTRYKVKAVLSDTMLKLVDGPATYTSVSNLGLVIADNADNYRRFVTALADRLSTRRAKVVWTDGGTNGAVQVANAFNAAFLAGLRSAVLPQQSLTHSEVTSVTACPRMYTRYTLSDLDSVAMHGVTIITQDNKYSTPYVRHDLTTDMLNGLLYSESSVTTNVDNISYAVSDAIKGFIGKANVTQSALLMLKTTIDNLLAGFTSDSTDPMVGPSLVRYEGLTVEQDPNMKDRVVVNVTYYVPTPMNVIQVYQMVYVADVTIEAA